MRIKADSLRELTESTEEEGSEVGFPAPTPGAERSDAPDSFPTWLSWLLHQHPSGRVGAMNGDELGEILADDLARRRAAHQYRQRRVVRPTDATHIEVEGRRYVNFCSNDYLGLTHHPRLIAAAQEAAGEFGVGAGAAGLIVGYSDLHARAEKAIAGWKNTQAAVLLPSGYQANQAAIQTFAALAEKIPAGVRFLIDKLAHASLVDAVRATGLPFRVFPHNGLEKLGRLLHEREAGQLQVVITESIFSMDGDAADLRGLAELKQRENFLLLLDEAHGSGVYGLCGAGYAAERGLGDIVDISIATLSKATGCQGGAVCASQLFCDALVNYGRAYIYSTSLAPCIPASIIAAIDVMRDEPERQTRVRQLAREVRAELKSIGFEIPLGDSPIIPVMMGAEADALAAAEELQSGGIFALAVRPPTVPKGTSRIRLTLSCDHTDNEVGKLIDCLRKTRRN